LAKKSEILNLEIFLRFKMPIHAHKPREKNKVTLEILFENGQLIINAQRPNNKT